MQDTSLSTADDVVNAVGGTKAASILTGKTYSAVSNWRKRNKLPPSTAFALLGELQRRGLDAPLSIWGIRDPGRADAA